MKKIICLLIVLSIVSLLSSCQSIDQAYTTGAGEEGTKLTIDCTEEIPTRDIIEIKFPLGRTDTFYFNDFCDDME